MSTPSYRAVVELHGWVDAAKQLSSMARQGAWQDMGRAITDEMLDVFAVSGSWHDLPRLVQTRYGDLLDRVAYYLPYTPGVDDAGWQATLAGFGA